MLSLIPHKIWYDLYNKIENWDQQEQVEIETGKGRTQICWPKMVTMVELQV